VARCHDQSVHLEHTGDNDALLANETRAFPDAPPSEASSNTPIGQDSESSHAELPFRAFVALVERALHAALGRCSVPPGERHELVQSALVKLTLRGGGLAHLPANVRGAYASKAVVKTFLNARRATERRRNLEHEWATCHAIGAAGGEEQLARADLVSRALEILEGLPEGLRTVIVACDLEGLSHAEAAHELGLPLGTVNSRHRKALSAWRQACLTELREEAV
jgi:RNA polymerase sigma-70 factor (ECF subfamily)